LNSGESVFNLHTAQLSIAYAPDVFGGMRRSVESAQAQAEAQRFQVEAAYLTLTTNVVVAAVQAASLRGQIAATEQAIAAANGQLAVLKRQLELGAIPESAVLAQDAALAQARAALPALNKQLQLQRDQLAALCGQFVADDPGSDLDLGSLHLPSELPISLPSHLVEQRPDVQAARAQLHAASAQIGVATAGFFPQLNISASAGALATQISALTASGNTFWSVAATAGQPLLDGGATLHRRRAAQAAFDQAAAQYRSTVIGAFQNVADVLEAIQADAQALAAASQAEQATRASLQIAQRQLELGDTSPLAVLAAEQAHQQATVGWVQAQASRLTDTAALFQALGGGWWNR
jgi:NodT family efflux transporter outer membrane factor (OMF) lipoprotein